MSQVMMMLKMTNFALRITRGPTQDNDGDEGEKGDIGGNEEDKEGEESEQQNAPFPTIWNTAALASRWTADYTVGWMTRVVKRLSEIYPCDNPKT